MGSVNISIKDEAYRFLKGIKSKDESYSDVILRFKEKKVQNGKALLLLAEKYKDAFDKSDWDVKKKRMNEFRKSFDERIQKTTKYMDGARNKK